MSNFSGLNVALSALYAQRRGLEITGHNVANANTEGYSRQRVNLEANGGPRTGTFWSRTIDTGGGVHVASITRFRDAFLEIRSALAQGDGGRLGQLQGGLTQVEALFNEPSDQSLAKSMSEFWSGWDDIANHPGDGAARTQLLQRGAALASSINRAADQLSQFRTDGISQLSSLTTDINTAASNVAELNKAIRSAVSGGLNAGDLMDQRDLLVNELAQKVGATIRPTEYGQVNVFVNGTALVSGESASALTLDSAASPVVMRWAGSNHPATVTGGQAGGMLELINTKLPGYSASLDTIALKLRDDVNAIHTTGAGLDSVSGRKFFDATSASDLAISTDIGTDTDKIAAALASGGTLDGSVALTLADLALSSTGAGAQYRSMIVGLGVETQSAQRQADIQGQTADQIDGARESASGVNTDEEMVAMVQFQHAYEAAARFLTAIDQMLDVLVNRTGLAGR